jgi:drug/metabolite transporter (DMT)-like permease
VNTVASGVMELWIPISIAAAFSQNLRFMLQKHLATSRLSAAGATYARFVFAAPLAVLLVVLLVQFGGYDLPATGSRFWIFAAMGGLSQIIATMLVVALFSQRNFTVGITFKKTEVVQTAFFSFLVLGEGVSAAGFLAIFVGLAGVILISDPPDLASRGLARVFNRASGLGLASGAFFGISGMAYRGASLSLDSGDFLIRAAFTLACVTLFQTLVMSLYLRLRQAGQICAVLASWRVSSLVGFTGMLGSLGWFAAFTLQNAAYVKALGQVELVFTFLASYLFFKERSTGRELAGIGLVVASILLLVLLI